MEEFTLDDLAIIMNALAPMRGRYEMRSPYPQQAEDVASIAAVQNKVLAKRRAMLGVDDDGR